MPSIESGYTYIPAVDTVGVAGAAIALNATSTYVSSQIQIPRTGTITGIKFATSAVTTGATITGTIETITDAKPSGTLIDANATGTVVVADTDDNVFKTITFAGNVSVTRGDFVSVKLEATAGTPNTLNIRTNTPLIASGFPNAYISSSATWSQAQFNILLTYSDGDFSPYGLFVHRANTNVSMSTTTSPDEAGTKFTAPYSASVVGLYIRTPAAANAQDFDMVLYDSSSNVLASQSCSKELFETALSGLNNTLKILLDSNVNILKGRTYRAVIKPTTTTTWTNTFQHCSDPTISFDGVTNPAYTYRTDAGAWTDDTTKVVPIGVILEKVYQPGGSFL